MNKKDLSYINGYLDNALTEKEMLEFADRMAADPEIRAELSDIALVKRVIKELPVQKPPRNYILTRAMAAESRKPGILERFFPMFRTAGVMASLALIFTFIFPFFAATSQISPRSAAPIAVQKSITESDLEDAAPMAAADLQPETSPSLNEIGLGGDTDSLTKASKGFRGGSPKMEYLVTAERMIPDDPYEMAPDYQLDSATTDEMLPSSNAELEVQQLIRADQPSRAGLSGLEIIRIIALAVVAICILWILLTFAQRKWAL
jgi:hypothetical protein